jgi:NOL1/NOP2/fmu family ribosome biogenesis protein
VFTPPKIFIDENGQFSEEGWEPPVPPPPFGIYLSKIERKPYRIQIEGYIEEGQFRRVQVTPPYV